jgi:Uncharacterized conserved protein (some members contain a von Willebrand factor type A (vWA) domain)
MVDIEYNKNYFHTGDSVEFLTKLNMELQIPISNIKISSEIYKNGTEGYEGEYCNVICDENKWIRTNVVFKHRGIYKLGRINIIISDPFNSVKLRSEIDMKKDIKVYPRKYNITSVSKYGKDIFLQKIDKNSTNEDQFMIKDVRRYKSGDSLKKIHWKLSAKVGELYVKNTDTISGEEYAVFCDMNEGNYNIDLGSVEEGIVSITVSLLEYLVDMQMTTKVFFSDKKLTTVNIENKQNYEDLLENVILMKSDGVLSFEEFIHLNIHCIHKSSMIILVTAALSKKLIENVIYLKEQGYNFFIYYSFENEETQALKRLLVDWNIYSDANIAN